MEQLLHSADNFKFDFKQSEENFYNIKCEREDVILSKVSKPHAQPYL